MNLIFDIAVPIFGLGILGYFVSRIGFFPEQAADGLSRFVFDIAVPIMLVRVFANSRLPDNVPWDLLASFYIPILSFYVIGIAVSRYIFKRTFMQSVITGLGCAFGNLILLGLPLTLRSVGEEAAVPYFIVLSLHGITFYTLTTILLELGRHHRGSNTEISSRILTALLTNPIIIAIVVGIAVNVSGVGLPGPLDQLAEYMQQAVAPCALFALGASLTRYHIAGQIRESIFIIMMKNILFPITVWFIAWEILELEPLWSMVVVIMAAQPVGVTPFIFAERYNVSRALAATTIFLSSVVSMFTITFILFLFASMGLLRGG